MAVMKGLKLLSAEKDLLQTGLHVLIISRAMVGSMIKFGSNSAILHHSPGLGAMYLCPHNNLIKT